MAIEHEVAMIAGLAGVLAGIPGVIAAWLSHRTRTENVEQHGANSDKLAAVHETVRGHGAKLDDLHDTVADTRAEVRDVKADVRHIAQRVDGHADELDELQRRRGAG